MKQQWIGLISVGEGLSDYGVSFGISTLRLFTFSTNMKQVGSVNIFGEMTPQRAAAYKAQCQELGAALVSAIKKPDAAIDYVGDQGHCPVCHGDMFTIIPGTKKAECPVCGITGELSLRDGQVCIDYTDDAVFHARLNHGGIIDHCVELHGSEEYCMELFGDQTWVTPRNMMEEISQWIADGLMDPPSGMGGNV